MNNDLKENIIIPYIYNKTHPGEWAETQILNNTKLKTGERILLWKISQFINISFQKADNSYCYASVGTLANETGISRSSCFNYLDSLEEKKYIVRKHIEGNGKTTNRIYLLSQNFIDGIKENNEENDSVKSEPVVKSYEHSAKFEPAGVQNLDGGSAKIGLLPVQNLDPSQYINNTLNKKVPNTFKEDKVLLNVEKEKEEKIFYNFKDKALSLKANDFVEETLQNDRDGTVKVFYHTTVRKNFNYNPQDPDSKVIFYFYKIWIQVASEIFYIDDYIKWTRNTLKPITEKSEARFKASLIENIEGRRKHKNGKKYTKAELEESIKHYINGFHLFHTNNYKKVYQETYVENDEAYDKQKLEKRFEEDHTYSKELDGVFSKEKRDIDIILDFKKRNPERYEKVKASVNEKLNSYPEQLDRHEQLSFLRNNIQYELEKIEDKESIDVKELFNLGGIDFEK